MGQEPLISPSHNFAEAMFKAAGAQQTAGGAVPPSADEQKPDDKGGDDVIDAEFEVKG